MRFELCFNGGGLVSDTKEDVTVHYYCGVRLGGKKCWIPLH